MQLKLIVVSGKANKGAVTLKPPVVIGRSRQAELTVAHPMISRRHCEIFEVEGLLMIRDLGSLNGTIVEGQRIEEAPLCPGNEFRLGPLTFRAEYEYEGELKTLPAPKIANEAATPAEFESAAEAPASQTLEETPYAPEADPPAGGELPDFHAWDQNATDAVGEPEEEEAVVEIDDLTKVADDQQQEESEPTPPPAPEPRQETGGDTAESPPAGSDDRLEDFLKGLD